MTVAELREELLKVPDNADIYVGDGVVSSYLLQSVISITLDTNNLYGEGVYLLNE